jgi:hypothetical protein
LAAVSARELRAFVPEVRVRINEGEGPMNYPRKVLVAGAMAGTAPLGGAPSSEE